MEPIETYTPMKEPKYCFVPACKNNSRDTQKVFFAVPSSAKQEWCNAVGISCPKRVIYVCEDHLNLEEDVENYRYWITMKVRPKLKSRLPQSLVRIPLSTDHQEIIEPRPSTSSTTSSSFMQINMDKIVKMNMQKLSMCRICLVENVRMHAVVNKSLQELYEKLTDIPFVTEDGRPMLVCFFCCTKIKQCAQFQRKCLEAEQLFAQMLNKEHAPSSSLNHGQLEFAGGYVTTPVELISIDAEYQEESDIIKQEPPDVCERQHYIIELKEEYQSDELELKHLHNSYSDVEGIPLQHAKSEDISPQYSEEDSADELPLMQFKTEVVKDQDISTEEERTREMIRLPVVRIQRLDLRASQPEDTVTDKQQENVLSNTVGRHYICDICQQSFTSKSRLRNHIRKHDKPYKCDKCEVSFSRKDSLTNHIRTHTGEKPYKCEMCQVSFRLKNSLTDHIRTHTGEKPYKCEMCQVSFSQRNSLTDHIRTHTGEKPYKCEMCQVSFSQKNSLTYHTRTHTGEKPYKCDKCEVSFSRKDGLTNHIRTHNGEKPYKCEMCQRSYRHKNGLTNHIRTHTGEKPYKCKMCQRSYRHRKNLTDHIRTHTGEKPYKCKICQVSFSQMTNLRRHTLLHTGEKPYRCEICHYSSRQKGKLTRHTRIHTDERLKEVSSV